MTKLRHVLPVLSGDDTLTETSEREIYYDDEQEAASKCFSDFEKERDYFEHTRAGLYLASCDFDVKSKIKCFSLVYYVDHDPKQRVVCKYKYYPRDLVALPMGDDLWSPLWRRPIK